MAVNKVVRPFLKWAGGKRQLLPEIKKFIPKYHTYYEPFLGGGAVLFDLQPKKAVVNDVNSELISCYRVIRDSLEDLIADLKNHENEESYYYELRDKDRSKEYKTSCDAVKRASRIIYLNKTCYNGLFRVNSQGQFNVPFGRYKNPNILDDAALKAVNKYLNNSDVTLLNTDFEKALLEAKKEDFIYLDPPYDPVSNTAYFTGYDVNCFGKNDQKRLKEVVDDLTIRGCKILLSNACTEFILELYKDYKIEIISATRAINSNAFKRGKVPEVLVRNYDL